jgi:ketosteroid isomerase-like protein
MFENVTIDPARERVNALEEDTDAAERTVASYFAACDQEDADRLAALFTQRAEVYLDGARVMPAADFVQEQQATWASRETTVTEVNLRGVSLMRPYGWAKSLARVQTGDGAPREVSQAVTFGLERRGEIWMITHLHISSAEAGP